MYSQAAHVMAVFVIKNNIEGYQDDKEFGASLRMLDYMTDNNYLNLAVYVV